MLYDTHINFLGIKERMFDASLEILRHLPEQLKNRLKQIPAFLMHKGALEEQLSYLSTGIYQYIDLLVRLTNTPDTAKELKLLKETAAHTKALEAQLKDCVEQAVSTLDPKAILDGALLELVTHEMHHFQPKGGKVCRKALHLLNQSVSTEAVASAWTEMLGSPYLMQFSRAPSLKQPSADVENLPVLLRAGVKLD